MQCMEYFIICVGVARSYPLVFYGLLIISIMLEAKAKKCERNSKPPKNHALIGLIIIVVTTIIIIQTNKHPVS